MGSVVFSHLLLVAQGEANSDNANDNDDDDADGDEFFDASEDGNISHTG